MAEPEKKSWGGARKGAGRHALSSGGRVRFQVSCQPEEKARIDKLAADAGKDVSRFLIDCALSIQ